METGEAYAAAARRIHARVAERLATSAAVLATAQQAHAEAETDMARYEGLIEAVEAETIPIRFLAELAAEIDNPGAPVATSAPARTRLGQDQPGSKAWLQGIADRNAGLPACTHYKPGTVAFDGWDGGWHERDDQLSQPAEAPPSPAEASGGSAPAPDAPQEPPQSGVPAPEAPGAPIAEVATEAAAGPSVPPRDPLLTLREAAAIDLAAGIPIDARDAEWTTTRMLDLYYRAYRALQAEARKAGADGAASVEPKAEVE